MHLVKLMTQLIEDDGRVCGVLAKHIRQSSCLCVTTTVADLTFKKGTLYQFVLIMLAYRIYLVKRRTSNSRCI